MRSMHHQHFLHASTLHAVPAHQACPFFPVPSLSKTPILFDGQSVLLPQKGLIHPAYRDPPHQQLHLRLRERRHYRLGKLLAFSVAP